MSAAPFALHPRLAADTVTIGRFTLSRVLLMNDARYPWCILVPERPGLCEIHQLTAADQVQLIRESSLLAACLVKTFAAHKMNVAALGNVVTQLHLHHVVRYRDDAAWPAPVWGRGEAVPYAAANIVAVRDRIAAVLAGEGFVAH